MKKTAKMKKTLMAVALAFCVGAWAADTARVTASGGATADYASLQAALDACTGGETVTMLADETVSGKLTIPVSVTLDLNGHLVKNTSGNLMGFADNVSFWLCGGGTLQGASVVFQFQSANSVSVNVTNCTVKGWVGTYGSKSTCAVNAFADSSFEFSFLGSGYASVYFNVYDGRFALSSGWWQGVDRPGTRVSLQGGIFNLDPAAASSRVLAVGYKAEPSGDAVYSYRVVEDTSAGFVARVTTAGGVSTDYQSLLLALEACTEGGETVTMLADESFLFETVMISTNIVLDLAGFTISKSNGDFLRFAEGVTATVRGGTIRGASGTSSCFVLGASGTVTVTNCTVNGFATVYGIGATLNFMAGTVANVRYLASGSGTAVFNIYGGRYAVSDGIWHATGAPGTRIRAMGGRFSVDPSLAVADGYHAVSDNETFDGVAYSHRVKANEVGDPYAVVTKDGEQPRGYETIQTALNACTGGETVTLCATPTGLNGVTLTIPASVTLDLGRYHMTLGNGYLSLASGVHLVLTNGTFYSGASAINMGGGTATVVDVCDCKITGFNLTFGNGTVNLYDGAVIDMIQFVSAWGKGNVNVHGGRVKYDRERDPGHETAGMTVTVYGGDFAAMPFSTLEGGRLRLAEGHVATYKPTSANGVACLFRVCAATDCSPVAVVQPDIYCLSFADAMASVLPSRYITLLSDLGQTTQITNDVVVNLAGHTLSASSGNVLDVLAGHAATISNGTLSVTGTASCAVAWDNATVTLGQGLVLKGTGDVGGNGCSTWIPGNSAKVIMDGATVETKYLHSIGASTGTLLVRGASVVRTPTFKAGAQNTAYAEGGYWSADPGAYVTNNFVKVYRANASPCKWQVKPWAAICADGWTFDLAEEVPTATGTCDVPSGPITVSLAGTIPIRKTLLVDLSDLALNSGTYADLSFVKEAALPGAVQVSYENGRLYAWEAKGTLIVFR